MTRCWTKPCSCEPRSRLTCEWCQRHGQPHARRGSPPIPRCVTAFPRLLQEQRRKAATTAAPKKHTLKSPLIDTSNGEGVTLTNGGAKSTRRKGALKRTVSSRMPPVDKRRPPYELLNLKKPRTGCSKRCFGRAANRHELLFWFDHNGPDFLEHLVRTSMMLLAVYVAVVGVLFHEYECQDSWSKCVVYYLAALVAPIVQLLYLPRVTRLYVVVTSVEMMKHRQVMDEVVRIERASKCLRALRLVSAIKGKVRKEGGSPRHGAKMDLAAAHKEVRKAHGSRAPSLGPVDESKAVENGAGAGVGAGALEKPASERVYGSQTSARYLKRRSELFEAFAMFDRDNSGEVNTDELEGVLSMLGLRSEAQELATRIVTEIDVDGSGTVSFNEFFEWIAEVRACRRCCTAKRWRANVCMWATAGHGELQRHPRARRKDFRDHRQGRRWNHHCR